MNRSFQLGLLRDRLAAIQLSHVQSDAIPTPGGVPLRLQTAHEWFAGSADTTQGAPLLPLLDVVRRGFAAGLLSRLVWIGRRVFPYPPALDRSPSLLVASVFIDPPNHAAHLWAIDLALRTGAPTAVIADAQGLKLPQTRRVQLAAGAGRGIALLARPLNEEATLSAATTRWRVEPFPSHVGRVAWKLTLLRNKDQRALTDEARATIVEWNDAQGLVPLPPLVERRAGATPNAALGA